MGWRDARECLPTRINIQSRGVIDLSACLWCENALENAWHLFVVYSYTGTYVEGNLDFYLRLILLSVELMVLLNVFSRFSDVGKFSLVLWSIWRSRNDKVWNDKSH